MDNVGNTGFIDRDLHERAWKSGGITGINYGIVNPNGDWEPYLPTYELQRKGILETMACVSYSCNQVVQTQLDRMLVMGQLTLEQISFLKEHNYLDANGHVNLSDRDLAYRSGTSRTGNDMHTVAETMRDGVLPEALWPWPDSMFDWDAYYQPAPQEYDVIRKRFAALFDIQHDWVGTMYNRASVEKMEMMLKQCPLQIAAPICSPWSTSHPVMRCEVGAMHCTMIYSIKDWLNILDHYEPFLKRLDPKYNITHVKRIIVMPNTTAPQYSPDTQAFLTTYKDKSTLVFNDQTGSIGWFYGNSLRALEKLPETATPVEIAIYRASLMSLSFQHEQSHGAHVTDAVWKELPTKPF